MCWKTSFARVVGWDRVHNKYGPLNIVHLLKMQGIMDMGLVIIA